LELRRNVWREAATAAISGPLLTKWLFFAKLRRKLARFGMRVAVLKRQNLFFVVYRVAKRSVFEARCRLSALKYARSLDE
jgi:hypothetical protein